MVNRMKRAALAAIVSASVAESTGDTQPWPIGGILPYRCSGCHCPTAELTGQILSDLEASCNIPSYLGLGTAEDLANPGVATDSFIYHSKWTQTSQIHPELMAHMCISPICQWRIEMAYNAFAECSTMGNSTTASWRHYTALSLTTVKHLILVMKSSKDSCKSTHAPSNIHTGAVILQKIQVTGVDIRSDTTLREAEIAFRMALSNLLEVPMRRLDVRAQPEPSLCHDTVGADATVRKFPTENVLCKHAQCGYGSCVTSDGYDDYTCLCNECYKLGVVNGYKTCVPDPVCFFKNPCDTYPSPCKCGGECVPCPECTGKQYQCKCSEIFRGDSCEHLVCPPGFVGRGNEDGNCGSCAPVDATNPCDPNPCQHNGACSVIGDTFTYQCNCPQDYKGINCEELICPDGFFEQAGKCVSVQTGVAHVKTASDPCAESPCSNGGECIAEGSDSYSCVCPPLYTGSTCEYKEDPCENAQCDGATCVVDEDTALGYYCNYDDGGILGFNLLGGRRRLAVDRMRLSRLENASRLPLMVEMARRQADKARKERSLRRRKMHTGGRTKRRLQVATNEEAMQYNWDAGKSLPDTKPLPRDFDSYDGAIDRIDPHCTVWQNAPHFGAELTLNVKCPRNEVGDDVDCSDVLYKLSSLSYDTDMQRELVKRVRYNCIATEVAAVSTPNEEIQIAECPSLKEFDFRWKGVWEACEFEKMHFGVDDEWKVYIGHEGVETLDIDYLPLFCGNPVCRGLAMDLAGMFSTCGNSAPGYLGQLSRKTKALKNSLKVCANPPGTVVGRQQLAVVGVLDPLSKQELLTTEAFLQSAIVNSTGIEADRLSVLTQPVLHTNDFWSHTPMTSNVVTSRSVVPLGSFRAESLSGLEYGDSVHASACLGLCVATASPGPDASVKSDPAVPIELTFSEPIRMGSCLSTGYCKITLTPLKSGYGQYILDASQVTSQIVVSGMTAVIKPPKFLKANANYTVTIDENAFVGEKTEEYIPETKFWFLTGPPTSSVVKVSITLGCDDQSSCDYYHSYMPDFLGDTENALVLPLLEELDNVRNAAKNKTDDSSADVPARRRTRRLQAFAEKRHLSSTESTTASAGDAVNEVRKTPVCETMSTWFLVCALAMVPIFFSLVATLFTGRAIHPWVQDVKKEGFQKTHVYEHHPDGGFKSKLVENPVSFSARLHGPWVYLPILMALSTAISAVFAVVFAGSVVDPEINYLAAVMSMTVVATLWNMFSICASTWVDPGSLPFNTKRHPKMQGAPGQWNLGSKYRQSPTSQYPIGYKISEKGDYDTTGKEAAVTDHQERVVVDVPRSLTLGTGAMSRLTAPIESAAKQAKIAHAISVLNVLGSMLSFTLLAMQLCPQPISIRLVQTCCLIGFASAAVMIAAGGLMMKHHTFQPVVEVLYKQDNKDYCGQCYLAYDVQFEENGNKVIGFNTMLPQAANGEGVTGPMAFGSTYYELIAAEEMRPGGGVSRKTFSSNTDVRTELNYIERYGNDIKLIFKANYYPHQTEAANRHYRESPYLPSLLPSSKADAVYSIGRLPASPSSQSRTIQSPTLAG
ncbi:unnamed protein product [Amoebophrya sp. A25]|nr:unnamed protein product [Amoebophrya sp. A25]|eukprot:GSA25T00012354001.1